jgi:hypothetical protein
MRARPVLSHSTIFLQQVDKSTRFSTWFDEAESPCRMVNLVPRVRSGFGSRGFVVRDGSTGHLDFNNAEENSLSLQEDRGWPANTEYDARLSRVC